MGSRYSRRTVGTTDMPGESRQLLYVHIDHLLQTERVNAEEAFEDVVPQESSVSASGTSTPSTTPLPPPPSVGVSKTTQDQTAETQKPVAEPIPQFSLRDSLVAQVS